MICIQINCNPMKTLKYIFILALTLITSVSCEDDFIDTEPADSISNEQIAREENSLPAILRGIYADLRTFQFGNTNSDVDYGQKGIMAMTDMLAEDIILNNFNWYIFVYDFSGRASNAGRTLMVWNTYYQTIANANVIIQLLNTKEDRTAQENSALGQALAIRSFCLFNLVRLYGHTYIGHENDPGVPLTDRVNFREGKPRGTIQDVYDQIIPDLEMAVTLLEGFTRENKQEIDQSVVHGFLANVYLETGNWQNAANNAALAKAPYRLMPGSAYATDGFDNINNSEWMWGADIDNETSTLFASFFSHFDSTSSGYGGINFGFGFKIMDARLYAQIPDSDLRKAAWVSPNDENTPFPPLTNLKFIDESGDDFAGDYSYMRSAEMFLVEAEAKARLGDPTAADVLFELVNNRDPEYVRSTNTGMDLVEEIYLQRRIELWGEGVSWFDLKRLKKPLNRTGEGSNHMPFGLVDIAPEGDLFRLQIPEDELNSNTNIGITDQNP